MNYISDIKVTDIKLCESAPSFLQSAMWGEFKSRFGWESKAFLIEWAGQGSPLLVLSRRLLPGFSFAYIPWGPVLPETIAPENREEALAELAEKLKPFLARNTIFLRFDLPWFVEEDGILFKKLKQASVTVQAPDTVIIDLCASCEEILATMKPKWRYNISLAEKKGVRVESGGIQGLEIFYSLMKETAARDGIAIHSINYYKTLFEICENSEDSKIRLYTAVHEENTLAAIIVLFRGKEATYLYGASSNIKRNLMAPYALQWRAMRDAKEAGCQEYDLFGIPPNEDPNHPMAGLYRFKTGFGGKILHRPGCWDYPNKKLTYRLFCIAETLRKKNRDRGKKRIEQNTRQNV